MTSPRTIDEIGQDLIERVLGLEQRICVLTAQAAFEKARADIAESKLAGAQIRIAVLNEQLGAPAERPANVHFLQPVRATPP